MRFRSAQKLPVKTSWHAQGCRFSRGAGRRIAMSRVKSAGNGLPAIPASRVLQPNLPKPCVFAATIAVLTQLLRAALPILPARAQHGLSVVEGVRVAPRRVKVDPSDVDQPFETVAGIGVAANS